MKAKKTYAVFGLGKYGTAVARELVNNGADVLAVDNEINRVNAVISEIPVCKCADVTDPEVLKQLGISNFDVVIVAMAGNLESSVLAVMLCKEAGVENVIAKCASEMDYKILKKVGADLVVLPENESGIRLAKNLLSSGFVDVIELFNDVSLVELDVKTEWVGKTLIELDLRNKYSINVVAIKKDDEVSIDFSPSLPLCDDMKLVVMIRTSNLAKLK